MKKNRKGGNDSDSSHGRKGTMGNDTQKRSQTDEGKSSKSTGIGSDKRTGSQSDRPEDDERQ